MSKTQIKGKMSNFEEENDHYYLFRNVNRSVNLSLIEDLKGYIKMMLEHKKLSIKVKISSRTIKEILLMPEFLDFLVEQKTMADVLEDTPQKPANFHFDGYDFYTCPPPTPRNVMISGRVEKFYAEYTKLILSRDYYSDIDTIIIQPNLPENYITMEQDLKMKGLESFMNC